MNPALAPAAPPRDPVLAGDRIARPGGVEEFLGKHRIHTVELGVCDILGVLRGKRVPARVFCERQRSGVAMSNAVFLFDAMADLVEADYANWRSGFPDFRLVPDLATLSLVPWRAGVAFVMCDAREADGTLVEVAPRSILRAVVENTRTLGFEPLIGPELEFYLLNPATKAPSGDRIACYSLADDHALEPAIAELRESLQFCGLAIEASNAEYAPGQFEVNLACAEPLLAADAALYLRYATREIAKRHGLLATFMAKPFTTHSGSGLHVHHSLWNADRSSNLFASEDPGAALSPLGRAYLGGLLHHIADLTALGAPTPNAYRRRTGRSFAPINTSWALDNRTVAVRVLAEDPHATRVEQRDAAADANPYLAIAAQVSAGLDGLRAGHAPPPALDGDAYSERLLETLPRDLAAALARLRESELARATCGDRLIEILMALGERELQLANEVVPDWERERYLELV